MSEFEPAMAATLKWEDPSGRGVITVDSGSTTKWGISQKAYPALDIAALTLDEARAIYRRDYWKPLYEKIASQNIASKLFDMGVNMGPKVAVKILQTRLHGLGELVAIDGAFGPTTLAAANRCDSQNILNELREGACEFYANLIRGNPAKYERYQAGWIHRARS